METFVLNKSYGEYSAGTRGTIMADLLHDDEVAFHPDCMLSDLEASFSVPRDHLTKCRNMTRTVPVRNRRARRAHKRAEAALLGKLQGKP